MKTHQHSWSVSAEDSNNVPQKEKKKEKKKKKKMVKVFKDSCAGGGWKCINGASAMQKSILLCALIANNGEEEGEELFRAQKIFFLSL
jgi:hypothetical protein